MTELEIVLKDYKLKNPDKKYNYNYPLTTLMEVIDFYENINESLEIKNLDELIDKYLQIHPSEINKVNYITGTALMMVCNNIENDNLIMLLINHGADVNIKNISGVTAFDLFYYKFFLERNMNKFI